MQHKICSFGFKRLRYVPTCVKHKLKCNRKSPTYIIFFSYTSFRKYIFMFLMKACPKSIPRLMCRCLFSVFSITKKDASTLQKYRRLSSSHAFSKHKEPCPPTSFVMYYDASGFLVSRKFAKEMGVCNAARRKGLDPSLSPLVTCV